MPRGPLTVTSRDLTVRVTEGFKQGRESCKTVRGLGVALVFLRVPHSIPSFLFPSLSALAALRIAISADEIQKKIRAE